MTILFFLSHPADFHQFKNVIIHLKKKSHKVIILIKTKDILEQLLQNSNWKYHNALKRTKNINNILYIFYSKFIGLLKMQYVLLKVVLKNKPDLFIGCQWALVFIGKIFGIPTIITNEDDSTANPVSYFFYPFAKHLLLPECCDYGRWEKKRISYEGYQELAYLHPNYFKPDKNVINQFNPSGSPYFILRLVSLTASHDIGKSGIYDEFVKKIIFILEKKGKVFITSERKLPDFLEKYRIKINPLNIHHALYYANLVIGDSQTMIAEAAVLGTPAIRFNDFVGKLSYLEELEKKYKLAFGFRTNESEFLIEKIDELLTKKNLKKEWQRRRQKMLYEKIDVTDFMVWFIDNYPESFHIMKDNPDYQYNFK